LQFSSGDQLADIVVELLPAFAFKLNHRRQHGSKKQESLIKTESYLRFVAVGMDVGMLQMVAIISTYFQCLMEQMSCRPGTNLRCFAASVGAPSLSRRAKQPRSPVAALAEPDRSTHQQKLAHGRADFRFDFQTAKVVIARSEATKQSILFFARREWIASPQ